MLSSSKLVEMQQQIREAKKAAREAQAPQPTQEARAPAFAIMPPKGPAFYHDEMLVGTRRTSIPQARTLQAGDRLLLCTDGVHGSLPEDELQEALNNEDCLAAAQALVGAARKQGSTDNATALVIQIEHIQGGLRALLSP